MRHGQRKGDQMKSAGGVVLAAFAAVLMACVGTASATVITSLTGTVSTPTIKAESEGHIVIHNPIAKIECASSLEARVESHGAGVPASGAITSLSFTGCTNSWHVTVATAGSIAFEWTSGYNARVVWTGGTIEATRSGVTCRYSPGAGTVIGTLTAGFSATLHLAVAMPFHSGAAACGTEATLMTGSYKVSSPGSLYVDETPVKVPGTTITSPTGTPTTPTIKAESEGHVVLDNPIAKIECATALEGKVEGHGKEAVASGNLSSLSFTGCTNSWHVTTIAPGELAIEWASGYNGKVTSTGATIEATRFGITCRYRTEGTPIGTITGGSPATLHLAAALPFHSGSFLCGSGATALTGSYKVSSPSSLHIDSAT
jgi:hypothetical protein